MPTTDTIVNNLIINKLTKAQYDQIENPSENELYLVPDEIDNTPTSGSENYITSGGVYTALQNKVSKDELSAQAYLQSESDPVFTASAAHDITSSDINSWNDKVSKAELSAQGYITSFTETDPVFTASAAYGITSSDITNWNAKVSKSDLSAQAYLTSHAQHKLTIATGTTTPNSGNNITFIESLTGTTTATDGDLTLTPTKKTITIPSAANNATITIQKGGTTVDSFTTDASSNKTINIPNELPSYSSSDFGKVLSVNSSGQLVWITPVSIYTGSGTPSNSLGNNGDIYLQS